MPDKPTSPSWARQKPGRLATIFGIAVVIVVVIVVALGLTLLNKSRQGPGGAGGGFGGGRRQPITVGTAKAVIGQIPITLDALGTVTPPVTATITSRIAGNLMAVDFKEGQMVRKGQVLAQIDPRPYRVALEQAQGVLAHDQALLANAQVDLKRYQTLLAQNSIASQQVDTQAALVKQDEAQLMSDKAGVDNAKLNLDYTTITAPVSGRVGLRQVDVGNYVSAGSTTGLVVITVVDPMDVVFSVPEDNIPRIAQRQQGGATLTATALNRDGGAQLAQGTLSTLDTQIDATTGTVKAKARFDNGDMALFPQQFVNIHLLVDTLCNQIIVPTTAVRHGPQGDYVFTVQPDKTAKVQYVKTGQSTPETVAVNSGVTPGDVVITDGGDRLRDGSPVLLPGDNPQTYQAAQAKFGRRGRGGQSGQRRGGRRGGAADAASGAAPQGPVAPGSQPPAASPTPQATAAAQQQTRDLAQGSCNASPAGRGRHGPPAGDHGQSPLHQAPGAQPPAGQLQGRGPGSNGQGFAGGQSGWRSRHRQGQASAPSGGPAG